MARDIGTKLMANNDQPGENSSVKKGMIGIIVGRANDSFFIWGSDKWVVDWESGKYKDKIELDSPKVTEIA